MDVRLNSSTNNKQRGVKRSILPSRCTEFSGQNKRGGTLIKFNVKTYVVY